jgi:hypothetical protein
VIFIFFIHDRPVLKKDTVVLTVSGRPQTDCAVFAGKTSVASHAPNLFITKPRPTSDANLFPPLLSGVRLAIGPARLKFVKIFEQLCRTME